MTTSRRSRRGATAIEFGLLLPVFTAIVFGIFDYGWVFYEQANVVAATRESLRLAVTLPQSGSPAPDEEVITQARTQLQTMGFTTDQLDSGSMTASYSGTSPNTMLTMAVAMPFQPIIGLVPTPDTVGCTMTMRLELQD